MPLTTEDGAAVDIDALTAANQEFARSMAAPPADEPQTPAPPRKVEGATAKRRGRPPGGADKARSAKTATAPGTDTRTPQKASEERAAGIAGLFQIAGAGCLAVGSRSKGSKQGDALICDAVTLAEHGVPIGNACATVAASNPHFAAALDKVLAVGPYGVLVSAVLGVGLQLAANHDLVPDGSMGTKSKKEILAGLESDESGGQGEAV
jgi:hypothetical protein